jgi:hypothetical protein
MFQYDFVDYSIFFMIYWDALEEYMNYETTDMYNLNYEEMSMDNIREELYIKYEFNQNDDLDEDEDEMNYIHYLFVEHFTSTFEDMIFNYKMNYLLKLMSNKKFMNSSSISNRYK